MLLETNFCKFNNTPSLAQWIARPEEYASLGTFATPTSISTVCYGSMWGKLNKGEVMV